MMNLDLVIAQITNTLKALRDRFGDEYIIKKDVYISRISQYAQYLDFVSVMNYGNDASFLESQYELYRSEGLNYDQVSIGIRPGKPCLGPSFTSINTSQSAAKYIPKNTTGETKWGIMIYTYSADIEQFTGNDNCEQGGPYPAPNDHAWQKAVVEAFHEITTTTTSMPKSTDKTDDKLPPCFIIASVSILFVVTYLL